MATSKKRYRVRNAHGVSPWFAKRSDAYAWAGENWPGMAVYLDEGSAIRRTKATDARKRGHTHPPGATRCRVCGV